MSNSEYYTSRISLIKSSGFIIVSIAITLAAADSHAQTTKPPQVELDAETMKKANDPMADTKAFNLNNYNISSLYGSPGTSVNQLLFRYAQPIGKFLIRATMPFIVSAPSSGSPTTGLGDFNMFALYSFSPSPGNKLGIGPLLSAPTGTHQLGAGKWQTGVSMLGFFAKSHIVQFGSLLQYQFSFAGDDTRPNTNLLIPQMFFVWQIGGGIYLRSTGVWSFDLTNGYYNVPLGLGLGKVLKMNKTVFNIFAEPQFTVLAEGIGQPKFQTLVGVNTQF
jgi:hypothetical protein